ncbi:MAG: HAMP domain-containing protein [Spirochaetales bacterium]|nr:HAMP domain-containing protein [Spirochaetales bacterium]
MRIQSKITLVVLPILIATLAISGVSAYFSATSGISRIADNLLSFKVETLRKFADSQWGLLVDNNFSTDPRMLEAARAAVGSYAMSITTGSLTELVFAYDKELNVAMTTDPSLSIRDGEKPLLKKYFDGKKSVLAQFPLNGIDRVGMGFYFEPFGWYVYVAEQKQTFYQDVDSITWRTGIILAVSVVLAVLLLFLIARVLTKPLTRVVGTMRDIITDADLSKRVAVEFQDETGELAHTFNIMVGELEKAYNHIKKYAFEAVLAQKREQKIRNIFQKYVPQEVINQLFENPEAELIGDNRVLAILFSDIRDFTTISERLPPDEVVASLNRYFSVMVDVILSHKGIVDKYIGDAIMAFFGAPIKHERDAVESVYAGLEMTEKVVEFNREQAKLGKPSFRIGVGITYGIVTVGNIGTEKKMDYTVIGDKVNTASRLEGLTKKYGQQMLISEGLQMKVKDLLPCREMGKVRVKGRTVGEKIFTVKRTLTPKEKEIWGMHNAAMPLYYTGDFKGAADKFAEILKIEPEDGAAKHLHAVCREYAKNPPAQWNGVEKFDTK